MWRKGSPTEARILIVDDEESNVRLLERALTQAGYGNITSTTQPREVSRLVAECEPDLILLDLMMPQMDGFEVMQVLGALSTRDSYLPILVLTADTTTETRRRALASGAKDFLPKPLDIDEVWPRNSATSTRASTQGGSAGPHSSSLERWEWRAACSSRSNEPQRSTTWGRSASRTPSSSPHASSRRRSSRSSRRTP